MAFKETLRELVQSCGGGIGAILMGYDGITVDEFPAPDGETDLEALAVEYASLLKEIRKTVSVLKTGSLEEVTILSEQSCAVMRPLDEEFFVALLLKAEGNLGRGRYLLKCAAPKLREQL